jgi:hypothetical protein
MNNDRLCLSEIKFGRIDGVVHREPASRLFTRRHGQLAGLAHHCPRRGVFGFDCSRPISPEPSVAAR